MCVYVCACMCACVCICMYASMHVCIYATVHLCMSLAYWGRVCFYMSASSAASQKQVLVYPPGCNACNLSGSARRKCMIVQRLCECTRIMYTSLLHFLLYLLMERSCSAKV